MASLVSQYRIELTSIRALNLLFYNYSSEDINALKKHRAFDYTWNEYLGGGTRTVTLEDFWEIWSIKWYYETQAFVLDHAMERYGEEAYSGIGTSEEFKQALNRWRNQGEK